MRQLLSKFWNDDCGALISTEFLFVATILVIGVVVGLVSVREAVNHELAELANAILALSQGYTISGSSGCGAIVDGTATIDTFTPVTDPVLIAPVPVPIDTIPCN